jgi:cytochrome c553
LFPNIRFGHKVVKGPQLFTDLCLSSPLAEVLPGEKFMPKKLLLRLSTTIFALSFIPTIANATDGETIMTHGATNPAAIPCISCHGPDGKGMAAAGFPRLAGLPAEYIGKQLRDFRSGARDNPVMTPIATALSDEEMSAVAKAYAARPKVNVTANPSTALRPQPGTGAWLATRGAWDRNIPECTLCHGPSGIGVGDTFPPLAGQSAVYIESQLNAWRTQKVVTGKGKFSKIARVAPTRKNDPNGLMQHIAADLSEAEIKSVAEYFESLGDSMEPFSDSQQRIR